MCCKQDLHQANNVFIVGDGNVVKIGSILRDPRCGTVIHAAVKTILTALPLTMFVGNSHSETSVAGGKR